jgi:hypothetical protein
VVLALIVSAPGFSEGHREEADYTDAQTRFVDDRYCCDIGIFRQR